MSVNVPKWVIGTNYVVGDLVREKDTFVLYMCTANHVSGTTNWPGAGQTWSSCWYKV